MWAHPVKFLDGWIPTLDGAQGATDGLVCDEFEGHLSDVVLRYEHGPLRLTRTDFVVENEPALFSLVDIVNTSDAVWTGRLGFLAQVNILPSWFSGWECGGVELFEEHGFAFAHDKLWQGRWGVVLGSSDATVLIEHEFWDRSCTGSISQSKSRVMTRGRS